MRLPGDLLDTIEDELGTVRKVVALGGGCISQAYRIDLARSTIFLKYDEDAADDFFIVEADGLERLSAATARIRIPRVLGQGRTPSGLGWLALEWLERTRPGVDFNVGLGEGLAEIHRSGDDSWGWHRDGYIGGLPQSNRPAERWSTFWRRERLAPQLERARKNHEPGSLDEWLELFDLLPSILAEADEDGPSLLHGDLWSGNVMSASGGGPVLIDPSVYIGHREVDLAMADLFGGFAPEFRDVYEAEWPLRPGYERRRPVYQLYYLLVHVNLFGRSYVERTMVTLREALSRSRHG